jgi:2-C-methyl-D-erythritol 2,4-cyclodiphosphate synthase
MTRVGIGYDVHRLAPGRDLVLGGITIPNKLGLLGHSDGDVLTHACIDALLGAANLGDIGTRFPSEDLNYKDIFSITLLEKTMDLLREFDWKVGNLDATIVAESPKLSPYVDSMRREISKVAGINEHFVSIKSSTTDGLGFTGEGRGIIAYVVALIEETR